MIEVDGGIAAVCVADITDESDAARIPAACLEQFERIDILVNNVGIGSGDSGVVTMDRDVWDHIFEVNLTGLMLTCKHVLPVMRQQGSGSIVNISSIAAIATTRMAAYTSSKAAVNALTQHMAGANARHGVRVNAIMPGLMDTPMAIESISAATGVSVDEVRAGRNAVVPLGRRMGTAWDTAYAALYLASDEASFVTGAVLPVDGGQSTRVG